MGGVSGRRSRFDLEHDDAVGGRQGGLCSGSKGFKVELVTVDHGREWLLDAKLRVEELHLDRLAPGKRDDGSRMTSSPLSAWGASEIAIEIAFAVLS